MENSKKKILATFGAVIVVGLLVGALFGAAPQARANVIGDFLNNLLTPFSGQQTSTNSASVSQAANAPLYQPVIDYENAVVNAVKKASPAVVSITISENVPVLENCPVNPFNDLPPQFQQFFGNGIPDGASSQCANGQTQLQEVGGGSGFIISQDGLILTNKHVVSDTGASYTVLTNDGKTYMAKVLARDPRQDLAVLKISASGLPTVTLGDSDGLELGQSAIAIGNALGQFSNTVSVGVVSGLSRTVTASGPTGSPETIEGVIQTDAAINPGNSGGPLLNLRGEVVGINTAIASNAENIGFAIPINRAKADISSVESTGQIKASYLGVRYLPITGDVVAQRHLSVTAGALVEATSAGAAVQPGSPAAAAGIQAGDIIISVNGQNIDAQHDLGDVISQHNVGETVTLTINRAGKTLTVPVTLTQRPNL